MVGAFAVAGVSVVGCESALGLDDARVRTSDDAAPAAADVSDLPDVPDVVSDVPDRVPNRVPYVVSSLGDHTCAVTPDKRAYCWGDNTEGQLGDGTTETRSTPVLVAPFDDVVDVSAGYTHSCLVRSNSDVYCWGKNDRGQLGDGTKIDRREASALTMSGALNVGVAGWHTCVVTALRTVRCWGDNYYGALGDSTFTARTRYVDVLGLSDVTSLAVGVMHNCAATDQGYVYCWGRSVFGELGYAVEGDAGSPDPNDPGSPIAQRVPGLTDVASVVAGEDHTCAIRKNGQVVCWGRNDYSQLGDGTGIGRTTPAPVLGDPTYAVHLTAGGFNSCATFSGGKVRCWGRNNFGQLGNGNTNQGETVPSPPIVWLADVERLSTGEHTCAWRKDGKLFCWGRNDLGQLGLGSISDYELQPREVTFPALPSASP
ncbi:RCC1 domain-containing protein [Labilithrix luteola]|uniref:RCC1 domain-containing protein n=1 Tax=Labilithrix luteola TaxID=1391654 RepID=UPI0011BA4B6B|nr:hypothetical protein [Labilithrix luteola]